MATTTNKTNTTNKKFIDVFYVQEYYGKLQTNDYYAEKRDSISIEEYLNERLVHYASAEKLPITEIHTRLDFEHGVFQIETTKPATEYLPAFRYGVRLSAARMEV